MRTYLTYVTLLAVAALSGSLAAQYARTQTAGTYTERTGNGVNLNWLEETIGGDDNAALVNLPFTFPYFDRSYNQCIVNTNGRVSFQANNPDTLSTVTLTPTVTVDGRDTIYGIGRDLYADNHDPRNNVRVFTESGRVVFQWKNITFFGQSGHIVINFQVHLLSSGNIEMVYGPETAPVGYTETPSFTSGITNQDGTISFAGFGNVLTSQTARPANGTTVTLTYTAPTPANFVRLSTNDTTIAPTHLIAPATNTPILGFRLSAVGTGNTVTQLVFNHADFSMSGLGATYTLVRDTGTIGAYNSEPAIGSAAVAAGVITVSGLSEAITSGVTNNYLLLINLTAVSADSFELEVRCPASSALPANAVSGIAYQERTIYASGPTGRMGSSTNDTLPQTPMLAGSTNNVIHSCQIVRDNRSPSFRLDSIEYTLTFGGGLTSGNIANLRWYRDNGTPGVFDGKDTLLVSIPSPATTNTFTYTGGISIGTGGTNFLLTVDILGTFTGNGTLSADLTDGTTTPTLTNVAPYGPLTGTTRLAVGTTAAVVLTGRPDVALSNLPVQPSDANVPALAFALRTNSGTSALTGLTFPEIGGPGATTGISGASLVADVNGDGRFDVGDTVVTGTLTVNAANITVTGITGQTIGTTPTNYLLSVTYGAGAMPATRQFSLAPAGVTSAVTAIGNSINGTAMVIGAGVAAAGVDVSITFLGTVTDVAGIGADDFFRMSATARGAGGVVPTVVFSALTSGAGLGNSTSSAIETDVYLEGAGTLGVLDSSDRLIVDNGGSMSGTGFSGGSAVVTTGQTLNYLVRIHRSIFTQHAPMTGRADIAWRGVVGGTNVRILSSLLPVTINSTFRFSKGGGKKDEGGCSTGASDSRLNYALLAGVLGLMFVALRTRRRAA